MEDKGGFQRTFLIFVNEDAGYESGQKPSGHIRIEVREGHGKLHAAVQHLKEDPRYRYGLYLVKSGRDTSVAETGTLSFKRNMAELEWEFNPWNVSASGYGIDDFDLAAILVEQQDRAFQTLVCPLAAYRGRKTEWRNSARDLLLRKGKASVPKQGEDVFSKYEVDVKSKYIPPETTADFNMPKGSKQDQAAGYGGQPAGYSGQPAGYSGQPAGYEAPGAGYQVPGVDYSGQPAGYSGQPAGYEAQGAGYQVPGMGYSGQPAGYSGQPAGYEIPGMGYQVPGMDYQVPGVGYQAPGTDFSGQGTGYEVPQYAPGAAEGTDMGTQYADHAAQADTVPQYQPQQQEDAIPQYQSQQPADTTPQYQPQQQADAIPQYQPAQQQAAGQEQPYNPTPGLNTGCLYLNGNMCGVYLNNNSANPCQNCQVYRQKKEPQESGNEPGDIERLQEELDRYFEVSDPFHSKRSDYKWWKVTNPVNLNNILYQCGIRSPLLFNPAVMMAHFKYRHLIIGIYIDRAGKREYVVCGVPGMHMVDRRPFGELCRWIQSEGSKPKYGAFGYWLAYVDPLSGRMMSLR